MKDEIIFICDCRSYEHQLIFWEDIEDNQLHVMCHLNKRYSFLVRIIHAVKYVFGYSSRYGDWDAFVFKDKDKAKLLDYLKK